MMDRSYQGTPKSSPGFVYFSPSSSSENTQKQSDSSDYLSFSESPRPRFSPNYYSSPRGRFPRGGSRDYPSNKQRYNRNSGGKIKSFNNSSSFNGSHNTSWKDDGEHDISKFLHPSFVEDPWAELERKLKNSSQIDCSVSFEESNNT